MKTWSKTLLVLLLMPLIQACPQSKYEQKDGPAKKPDTVQTKASPAPSPAPDAAPEGNPPPGEAPPPGSVPPPGKTSPTGSIPLDSPTSRIPEQSAPPTGGSTAQVPYKTEPLDLNLNQPGAYVPNSQPIPPNKYTRPDASGVTPGPEALCFACGYASITQTVVTTTQTQTQTAPAPSQVRAQSIDILVVADVAGMTTQEFGRVNTEILQYLRALVANRVEFNIGIVPARIREDLRPNPLIFRENQPLIISSAQTTDFNALSSVVTDRMSTLQNENNLENFSFLTLNAMLRIPSPDLIKAGMFRQNASLQLILVSAKNELCSYPQHENISQQDVQLYNENCLRPVTGESIYTQLKSLVAGNQSATRVKGYPILTSGIYYTSGLTAPADRPRNVVGTGYKKFLDLTGGYSFDLAGTDSIVNGLLNQIGVLTGKPTTTTTQTGEPRRDFNIETKGAVVDDSTLCILVDGEEVEGHYTYVPACNGQPERNVFTLDGHAGCTGSKIEFFYCGPKKQDNAFIEAYNKMTARQRYQNLKVPSRCTKLQNRLRLMMSF